MSGSHSRSSPSQSSPSQSSPSHASPSAASHLPPAFPGRAAWGTAQRLRAWQAEALEQYRSGSPRDFLAVATPGAGKTTFALKVATDLFDRGVVRRLTVVAPTEHLKTQWADAAERVGIRLDPGFRNAQGRHGRDFDGVAVTYAQVAARSSLHRARTHAAPTLVVLDEVHHGGDALSWGEAIRDAFEPAARRLSLTGTPFRSDTAQIPFVRYERGEDGIHRSRADYSYGYGRALTDGVVRPVMFLAYAGEMRWRTRAGDEVSARLGEPLTKDLTAQAWRTALDPGGQWVPSVLAAADRRLSELRRGVPDAGGLVIATDQAAARDYAAVLRHVSGHDPVVVLSDDDGASEGIARFAEGDQRWMVAVRMVSEGVDVPRLAVGVYATSAATPLYFSQAVGRFVRARRKGETASIFLPSVPQLFALAGAMELERDHALDRALPDDAWSAEDGLVAAAQTTQGASDALTGAFEALDARAAFDRVLFDGAEFGTGAEIGSAEEEDFLGIPGLLEPDQVTTLLRQRQQDQAAGRRGGRRGGASQAVGGPAPGRDGDAARPAGQPAAPGRREIAALRKELGSLVSAWARRTGQPHGVVHTDLRQRCGGQEVGRATADQIQARMDLLRSRFVRQA